MTAHVGRRWLLPLLALTMVAAACGSSSNDSGGDTDAKGDIIDENAQQAAQDQVQNASSSRRST